MLGVHIFSLGLLVNYSVFSKVRNSLSSISSTGESTDVQLMSNK